MAKQMTTNTPLGRFSTAPSLAVAARICSSDNAHAAQAATYRYESRCGELVERFETEMEKVRSAYMQELAGLELE